MQFTFPNSYDGSDIYGDGYYRHGDPYNLPYKIIIDIDVSGKQLLFNGHVEYKEYDDNGNDILVSIDVESHKTTGDLTLSAYGPGQDYTDYADYSNKVYFGEKYGETLFDGVPELNLTVSGSANGGGWIQKIYIDLRLFYILFDMGESDINYYEGIYHGQEITSPTTLPIRDGYNFSHWQDENGNEITSGATCQFYASSIGQTDYYMEAVWTPYWNEISYNLTGGTIEDGDFGTVEFSSDDNYHIPTFIPVDDRHIFKYWTTESDGSGDIYYAGDQYKITQDGAIITLYANWERRGLLVYGDNVIEATDFIVDENYVGIDEDCNLHASSFNEHNDKAMVIDKDIYAKGFMTKPILQDLNYVIVSNMEELSAISVEMYKIKKAQEENYQGIKTVYLRPGTYTLTEEYCYSFASSDGTMNYKSPFHLKYGFRFIGLGNSPSDVVIDAGTFVNGGGNSAFAMNSNTLIKNLTINSTGGSKISCIKSYGGYSNITLDTVILNNYSSYAPALNLYNTKEAKIKNCQFNNLKSANVFSPIFVDFSDVTITNTHLYSVYNTLSIAYNYREGTSFASTLNVDDTVTGAQGGSVDSPNTTGLTIYSAAPSDIYTDVVNVNGIQIMHTDETSKGTASNIDGWHAYDANDWDGRELIITYNYNGYLYTTREYTADEIKSALKAFNLLL